MKFKREIITIIMVICMLFMISAISAADSSIDAVGETDESIEAADIDFADDNLATENDGEILGETDDGTFAALNTKISGASGTVTLENDYEYSSTDSGTEGITISSAITIDGDNHIIDAKGASRIFYVSTSNVVIKNVVFKNGKTTASGGAIYAYTNDITIINCTFLNNEADNGGALYSNAYSRLGSVTNSTFINNKANGQGAVVYNYADTGTLDGCTLVNNSAGTSIIYTYSAITVKNSILVNNVAGNIFSAYSPSITANNNWWGTTADDNQNMPANLGSGVTADKYYVLDMALDDQGGATVTLNNLYENGVVAPDSDYALPSIKFDVSGKNIEVDDNVVIGSNGEATIQFTPADAYALTISYNGVELTRDVKPTFSLLKDKINADGNEIALEQDYIYDSAKDSGLTNGIEFAKDMTIDGQGHIIDAKQSTNIFYFNDNTDSYSLTLKNIIFANATGTNGAAVYFKGNKIEIINCTFINNAASSQGDAVYIADASSNANKITESRFINNTGSNSVVYANLDSTDAKLNLDNSIFVSNDASYNVKGKSKVIAEHNWFGNTIENYDDDEISKTDGITLNNWLFLKIDADAALKGTATISLNNLYDGSQVSTYDEYSLPAVTLNIGGINTTLQVSSVSLGANGQTTYQFKMNKPNGALTATYEDVTTTKELEYVCVDDGSFKALNEIIWFSSENDVIDLTKDYVYSETDTITPGIQITKTITIDGHGNTIDAKGKCGIFLINSPNVVFKNITFKNGIYQKGGAIYASQSANYLTVDNCTFINNTATNTDGGAIWSGSYNFGSVVDSTFINNTAVEDGAAIFTYSYYTVAVVDRCVFINNSAPYSIIYAYYNFNPHDSIFLNNSASKVFTGRYSGYSDFNVGTNWYGNTYDNYDSAIPSDSTTKWLFLDIKFYEDFAIVSLNNLYSSGSSSVYSGYDLPEITLNINSTTLNLNTDKITLDSTGKAIVPYTKISEDAKLTVSNEYVSLTKDCKIGDFDTLQNLINNANQNDVIELSRNYTYLDGIDSLSAGISIAKEITIDGKGNTIDGSGLARIFYITSSSVTLKNINFNNGYATHGGAIYYNGGSITIINCSFVNNTASSNPGGAMYLANRGFTEIDRCTFKNNSAKGTSVSTGQGTGGIGGAVFIYGYTKTNNITNCDFYDNYAYNHGSAVYIEEQYQVTTNFIECNFLNNTARVYGTVTSYKHNYADSTIKTTNFNKCIFINNEASSNNKDIYLAGTSTAKIFVNNSIFISDVMFYGVSAASTPNSCDVNNNFWWDKTMNNYNYKTNYNRVSGVTSPTKWLYFKITDNGDETTTISLNNVYDNNDKNEYTYNGELPQITLNLTSQNVILNQYNPTFDKFGKTTVGYDLSESTGSLTMYYNGFTLTQTISADNSFTTLNGKINNVLENSILTLTHNYTFNSTKDSALTDGIVIDKDLTIDGQGCTIDANDAARIFKINDNTKNIVLKNIRFINAVGDNGAAVYANCNNIEVINCTFESNEATANGDALYIVANGCDITESTFINNIGSGSAIYLDSESDDAEFNIDNSILINNGGTNVVKAKGDLTAEYNWWGNTVDNTNDLSGGLAQKWYVLNMTVDDTQSIAAISLNNLNDGTSYENYALPAITLNMQAANGAVRKDEITLDENGDATVGYIATDNDSLTASYNGVSITREINYNEETDYSLTALKKLIDQANDNDVIELTHEYEYAAGIDDAITAGIDITKNNLTINGNGYTIDAKEQTRIFNIGVADSLVASNVSIKNTTFVNGKISGQGGSIRWYGRNGTLSNCTFENNSATNYGGAVYWYAQYGNVTNCTFKNNVVTGYNGGAIYVQSKNVNIVNSTFIENRASNGGSIYINAENVTVINSTFIKNTAGNGAAISVARSNVIINNSTFTDNEASTYGGAVYLSSGNNIAITDSTFEGNKATSHGGAIYSNAKFNIKNSTFKGNKANSYGGALYYDNSAGGAIYDATFINNSANRGGAIYTYAGVIDINKTDFINNTAQGSSTAHAGAIYDQSSDKLSIANSNFIGNHVKSGGNSAAYAGAIYTSYGEISIANSTFNRNSIENLGTGSCYGSVICWYNNAKGNIINSSFLNNHGKSQVSAVMYGSSAEVNITNSIFLNNTYGDSNTWRVIYRSGGTFNFTDCWFGKNNGNSEMDDGTTSGTGITYNNKLTLIAVHDEDMAVGEDREIKFVLEYVENGNMIIYDSSKLPKVNFILSSVNGTVDKSSALMDETVLFNANQSGKASITAEYNGIIYTEELNVKDKPTITVEEPITVHVNESVAVNVVELIPSDASLAFSSAEGDEFIEVMYNGYVYGLKEGTSTVYIKFNGNDNYTSTTVEVPVSVIKYDTWFTIDQDSIEVDWGADSQYIAIGFDSGNHDNNQSDSFLKGCRISNDSVAKVSIVDNKPLLTFYEVGTTNITFYFEENDKYYGSEKNITVTVKKVASSVGFSNPVSFFYTESGTTTLILDGVDDVSISVIDHPEAVIDYNDGTHVVTVSNLSIGTYDLKVVTVPDSNHLSVENTTTVSVSMESPQLEMDYNNITVGEKAFAFISMMANGEVTVTISQGSDIIKTENLMISNGFNKTKFEGLNAGYYNISAHYEGVGRYNSSTLTYNLVVRPIYEYEFGVVANDTAVTVTLPDDATGNVVVKVDGKEVATVPVTGSTTSIPLDLAPGDHIVEVAYSDDDRYAPASETKEVTVAKQTSTVKADPVEITEGETATLEITVPENATGVVLVDVSGNKFYGDIKDGKATVDVVGLTAGNYTATLTYAGDDKFDGSSGSVAVNVTTKPVENITVVVDGKEYNSTVINGTATVDTDMPETIKNLTDELEEAKANATALAGNLTEANAKVDNLIDQLAEANANATALAGNLTEANAKVDNLTVELGEAKANATGLAEDLADANAKVNNLTAELAEAQANATSLANELAEAQDNVTALANELAEAQGKVDNLTAELGEAKANATGLAEDLADANAKVDNLTGQLAEAQANATALAGNLTEANAKVDNLTGQLAEANANATALAGNLTDANKVIEDLTKQLEDALANATNKTETVVVDGVEYPIEYVNGTATVTTNKTEPDNNITVIVDGKEYPAEVVNGTATVTTDPVAPQPAAPSVNITAPSKVAAGEAPTVKVDLPSDATGNVTVKVDGKEVANVPVENGTANVPLSALGGGSHAVEVAYTGDDKYAPATEVSTINAEKKATHIEIDSTFTRVATDFNAGERGANQTGYLLDEDGKPVVNRTVQIAVNGIIYNKTTDENGKFYHQINLAAANTYTYALVFSGDELYNASLIASSKLTVTKKATSISASNKAFKATAKTKTISVTLKTIKNPYDGKTYLKAGKKITLKVNGVTYTAKINAKGVAKFTIKLTKKGKYTATVKFAGDKTYKASSKKITITIK